jgi:hypothetical protein
VSTPPSGSLARFTYLAERLPSGGRASALWLAEPGRWTGQSLRPGSSRDGAAATPSGSRCRAAVGVPKIHRGFMARSRGPRSIGDEPSGTRDPGGSLRVGPAQPSAHGTPLCQDTLGRPGLGWILAGSGSGFSEEPVWGCEPVALESEPFPVALPGPPPHAVAGRGSSACRRRWRALV